jgi:hypothetical protein
MRDYSGCWFVSTDVLPTLITKIALLRTSQLLQEGVCHSNCIVPISRVVCGQGHLPMLSPRGKQPKPSHRSILPRMI